MDKKLLIGIGVLAVAGIGLFVWKKRKEESEKTKLVSDNSKKEIDVKKQQQADKFASQISKQYELDNKMYGGLSSYSSGLIKGFMKELNNLGYSYDKGKAIQNSSSIVSCADDEIECTRRGVAGCCKKPKPTGAIESGFNGDTVYDNSGFYLGRAVTSSATPYIRGGCGKPMFYNAKGK